MLRQHSRLNCWALQNPRTVKGYWNCKLVLLLAQNTLYNTYRYHILHEVWTLLFLLLFLASPFYFYFFVPICLSVSVFISIFLSVLLCFRLLPPFFLVYFKFHINFSHWWKVVIRPILAKFLVGSSLVFWIAVSFILQLVKKSTVTTTW